jgi:predicted dinucleotide-binding enzyme
LFAEAVEVSFATPVFIAEEPQAVARDAATALVARSAPDADDLTPFLIVLRSASNPRAAEIVRDAIERHVGRRLARQLPAGVPVLKAFNVNLADTLFAGTNGTTTTTVLFAGDDAEGKIALTKLLEAAGLRAVDAGPLQRSRELEAMGYLQITLAASGKTQFESGFTLLP